MRVLLDTHLLIWISSDSPKLSSQARTIVGDARSTSMFSTLSIWEVAIKSALGRPDFRTAPRLLHRGLLARGYEELPISSEHAIATGRLPPVHKDPFDRLLVAQAMVEGLMLLTADPLVTRYPGSITLV